MQGLKTNAMNRKSIIRSLLVPGLLLLPASGLYARSEELFVGIKGGISIPSLRAGESQNDWNKNYESRIGPYFGAFAEFPISRYFSFQPEINYAAEGGKRRGIQPMTIPAEYLSVFQQAFGTDKDYLFATLNNVSRINYLQIPLMIKFSYPVALKGRLKVFAQAGPYIGYLVAAKQIVKSNDLRVFFDAEGTKEIPQQLVASFFGSTIDTAIGARNDLHKFNTGLQGGAGISYQTGRSRFFLEGGGNYGLLYIQKGDEHGKNNIGAATLLAGYAYNIRKKKS